MNFQITFNSEILLYKETTEQINKLSSNKNLNVSFPENDTRTSFRNIDPIVLVAIVGAIGTGLGALLTGLLQIAQQSTGKKIILQTQSGSRLEVPANISPKDLDILIEKLKKLESTTIKIAIP